MNCNKISKLFSKLVLVSIVPVLIFGVILVIKGIGHKSENNTNVTRGSALLETTTTTTTQLLKIDTDSVKLWPNGRVPYTIDQDLVDFGSKIEEAMKSIEDLTCIRFLKKLPNSMEKNWISFVRDDTSCAYPEEIGMSKKLGSEEVRLSVDCLSIGQLRRILALLLGIGFEETRPDRNRFIKYTQKKGNCSKTEDEVNDEFDRLSGLHNSAVLDLPFDYASHMFLQTQCFQQVEPNSLVSGVGISFPSAPTVEIPFGSSWNEEFGTFSVLDIEKFNSLYNCSGCQSLRFRPLSKVADDRQHLNTQMLITAGHDIDDVPLYICRMYHQGTILIGKSKITPHENICWGAEGQREYLYRKNFQLLTNTQNVTINWILPKNMYFPPTGVIGGRTLGQIPLYIGRCEMNMPKPMKNTSTIIPGSALVGLNNMLVSFGGKSFECSPYEILTCQDD